MNIENNTVATIHYKLTGADGALIESSEGGEPLAYVHGVGNIIPGLETALTGRTAGDSFSVSIAPAAAYGERDGSLVQIVPGSLFAEAGGARVGLRFHAEDESGTRVFTVTGVDGDQVTVDGNHPLAGQTLNFEVTVVEVRAATDEELEHGHAHGPEGHGH
jgi:FKBP-type peptidyl-prolyl cis-trans isomerase SlyD